MYFLTFQGIILPSFSGPNNPEIFATNASFPIFLNLLPGCGMVDRTLLCLLIDQVVVWLLYCEICLPFGVID
jgi:hypothetical protein